MVWLDYASSTLKWSFWSIRLCIKEFRYSSDFLFFSYDTTSKAFQLLILTHTTTKEASFPLNLLSSSNKFTALHLNWVHFNSNLKLDGDFQEFQLWFQLVLHCISLRQASFQEQWIYFLHPISLWHCILFMQPTLSAIQLQLWIWLAIFRMKETRSKLSVEFTLKRERCICNVKLSQSSFSFY